jgi:hypothetical protein
LRWSAIISDRIGNGCEMLADKAGKPADMQAAMKTHLSQPAGIGAFDGQHGISLAIPSIASEAAISDELTSSAIAGWELCNGISAITGRESGASARPAIMRIASSRRMAKRGFTSRNSHKWPAMESSSFAYHAFHRPLLIGIKLPNGPQA